MFVESRDKKISLQGSETDMALLKERDVLQTRCLQTSRSYRSKDSSAEIENTRRPAHLCGRLFSIVP